MADKKNPLRNVQIKFRRSKPLTKVVVIAAILLSTVALLTLRWVQTDIERQTQEMREEAARLEQENAELDQKSQDVHSVEGAMDIAESELDYVHPDATFFEPQGTEDN